MANTPILLGNSIYERTGKGTRHPLAWPKTAPTLALIRRLPWYDPAQYVESPQTSSRRIKAFHDPNYVDAAFDAETQQMVPDAIRLKFGLGSSDNPIFPSVIHRASAACGAALKAAALLRDGGVVHSPLGGAHHSQPARASGFGYFNDLVLGIMALTETSSKRVAYIDLDAHHGNAVEDAFAFNPNVMTVSVHQQNCWPHSGIESDPKFNVYNLPVPAGFNDSEMAHVVQEGLLPLLDRFAPDAIVIQAGADALEADTMMDLALSNLAYFDTIKQLRNRAPRIWVTGGGGYNPWAVVRCWTGIWCVLNDRDPDTSIPRDVEDDITAHIQAWPTVTAPQDNWLSTLQDAPRPGEVRQTVVDTVARCVATN
ncbi:acetoin utilization protein AcuC [uncultured Litoreibacter sp.]|uniref:acetoin utilization protein AcuC n=1 Tax=uncultured Litoreibacter sp. TaxID=1392394 RepID=UPI002624AE49|nr:acetoin utilization protein AcuC [uncultured Litoreibacter sp.]